MVSLSSWNRWAILEVAAGEGDENARKGMAAPLDARKVRLSIWWVGFNANEWLTKRVNREIIVARMVFPSVQLILLSLSRYWWGYENIVVGDVDSVHSSLFESLFPLSIVLCV